MSHTRYGLVFGALLCIAAIAPLPAMAAASVSMFDGRPAFSEGEGRGYYVWRDGDTWHVRWTTFGSVHHFSGSVVAEGGDLESLKRIDVETERRVIAARRAPHVTIGPRGRARVVRRRAPVVATREQDHINKDGDRRITFSARTDADIDGFDFKVDDDVRVLRFSLNIDGDSPARAVAVGRDNRRLANDSFVVDLR